MFITFLGTFASGKSLAAVAVAKSLGLDPDSGLIGSQNRQQEDRTGRIVTLGRYKPRGDGSYTGGMDNLKSQSSRWELLKAHWLDPDKKVIIGESHMLLAWESVWLRIRDELLPKRKRKIVVAVLSISPKQAKLRWEHRSGRVFKDTQKHGLEGKANRALTLAKILEKDPKFRKCLHLKYFDNNRTDDFKSVVKWVLKHCDAKAKNIKLPEVEDLQKSSLEVPCLFGK
jgi:hypothetical protein